MKYLDRIVLETELDIPLMSRTHKGKRVVRTVASNLKNNQVWVIKAWGVKFSLRDLVDFLYEYDLDVFDIEYGSIVRIYVCLKDSYRIQNSVVYSLKNNTKVNSV